VEIIKPAAEPRQGDVQDRIRSVAHAKILHLLDRLENESDLGQIQRIAEAISALKAL